MIKNNDLLLPNKTSSATLSLSAVEELYTIMTKENQVKQVHKRKIYQRKDGRPFTKISENGILKQITGKDKKDLYSKLYDFYFGDENISLKGLYPRWIEFRQNETPATSKTIKEDICIWNTMLVNSAIATIPLKDLKPRDCIKAFRIMTKDRTLTRKRFNNIKSVLNNMIYYAIEEEIIEYNVLRDIDYRKFTYKPENRNIIPYSEEERQRIINHLGNDLYDLAINLDFHMVIRVGEIKALKWSDIKNGYIHIQRFMNDDKEIINHVKGNTAEGVRYIPISSTVEEILDKIKKINPSSEYLFIKNGQPLNTNSFNRRLKKHCQELDIEYRSSHKIRFSSASILKKNGMDETEIQKLLGHTTLNMTLHYLRNITPEDMTKDKFNAILG